MSEKQFDVEKALDKLGLQRVHSFEEPPTKPKYVENFLATTPQSSVDTLRNVMLKAIENYRNSYQYMPTVDQLKVSLERCGTEQSLLNQLGDFLIQHTKTDRTDEHHPLVICLVNELYLPANSIMRSRVSELIQRQGKVSEQNKWERFEFSSRFLGRNRITAVALLTEAFKLFGTVKMEEQEEGYLIIDFAPK